LALTSAKFGVCVNKGLSPRDSMRSEKCELK
jgi:hypothetical protein